MRICICNQGYSGYWVACWRELMSREGVELRIYTPQTHYPYAADFLAGLPVTILSAAEMADGTILRNDIAAWHPDVLLISGWASPVFCSLAHDERLKDIKKLLMMDSAWSGSIRQILNRFRLRRFVKQLDGVIVGGERGRKFARWLGFPAKRIYTSIYGYDAKSFEKDRAEWPRRFCFVGRYAPVKGILTLVEAYREYRTVKGNEAWPLDCYGNGDLKDVLAAQEGIVDHGFLQPDKLPDALLDEGVFVFPSLHEPWGVALAEACGSGLPAIVSDKVTSGDDLVEDEVNGFVFKAGSVRQLCAALCKMHDSAALLPKMGTASKVKARHFAPDRWANRWMEAIHDICR